MANFKEAIPLELDALTANVQKLDNAIYTEKFCKLSKKQQELLEEQLYAMREYQRILRERMAEANGWSE